MTRKNPTRYKFRANSPRDVQIAMDLLPGEAMVDWMSEDSDPHFPDCTVTVSLAGMGLIDVRCWLAKVPGGQLMCRTVALEADFTGEPVFNSVQDLIEAQEKSETCDANPTFQHYARHEDAIARLVEAKLDHDRVFLENTGGRRSSPEQAAAIRRYRNGWFNLIIEALGAKTDGYAADRNQNPLIAMRQQLLELTGHVHAYLEADDLETDAGDAAMARLREIGAGFQRRA